MTSVSNNRRHREGVFAVGMTEESYGVSLKPKKLYKERG